MDKLFTVSGVSKNKGSYKVRFANDIVSRIKILAKSDQDIQLIELPQGMDKPAVVTYLKTTDLYTNPKFTAAIDAADAKYNAVKTVKVTKAKADKPSIEAIKSRAKAKEAVAE